MHSHDYSLDDGVAGILALDAGIDPHLAVEVGEDAQDVLSYLRDAAHAKSERAKATYVRKAQAHLKDICSRQHPDLVQAIQTKILALQGRGGDTELAHLTPGEVVLPPQLQTPEVMAALQAAAGAAGIDVGRITVGDSANSTNPETGMAEYRFSCVEGPGNPCRTNQPIEEITVYGTAGGGSSLRPGISDFAYDAGGGLFGAGGGLNTSGPGGGQLASLPNPEDQPQPGEIPDIPPIPDQEEIEDDSQQERFFYDRQLRNNPLFFERPELMQQWGEDFPQYEDRIYNNYPEFYGPIFNPNRGAPQ